MKTQKKKLTVKEQLIKKAAEKMSEDPSDMKVDLVPGNDADLTSDDMEALGASGLSQDMGDDEDLKHRVYPIDFSGNDLDIPGSELDDASEKIGSEDEENNPYSIGGDAHDKLEETNNI